VPWRDVFVSYSHADREAAMELVACVEAHGIECWVAPRDVAPAADWAAEIVEAIAAARVMVLVFSASANDSPQVRREVERAVHKGTVILPVRIEHVLPTKSLEYFLSTQHWLDAFPAPREPHYLRLCASLTAILSGGSASAADTGTRIPNAIAPAQFDEATLRVLEGELARYVGPIAKHLVRRAAPYAQTREDLVRRLSTEIEPEKDRRAFLMAAQ
jgi:hypothetical protein